MSVEVPGECRRHGSTLFRVYQGKKQKHRRCVACKRERSRAWSRASYKPHPRPPRSPKRSSSRAAPLVVTPRFSGLGLEGVAAAAAAAAEAAWHEFRGARWARDDIAQEAALAVLSGSPLPAAEVAKRTKRALRSRAFVRLELDWLPGRH